MDKQELVRRVSQDEPGVVRLRREADQEFEGEGEMARLGIVCFMAGLLLIIGTVGGAEFGKMHWMAAAIGIVAMAAGTLITRREEAYAD